MKNKKKFVEAYILSTVGVIGMIVLLIAVNVISKAVNFRGDLTEENIYTLSDGTRQILKKMDTAVTIRFYYSKEAAQMPVNLKSYAGRVEDLLKEYREGADGNIVLQKFNPTPDSDAEDSARLDGVYGQNVGGLGGGEKIYLGLAVSCLDENVALPFLSPERENLLEYDLTRAIYRVQNSEKPVLGVMSSLPVMGGPPANPMMAMQGRGKQTPPWMLIAELKRDFDVRKVETTIENVADDIDVLMLIHATKLSDKALFAIDQFVLRGGRLLAFVDPMSMVESQNRSPQMQQMYMPPGASTLGKLFDAWGVEFVTEKLLADSGYMAKVSTRNGPQSMPLVLTLTKSAVNADDPATSQLENLLYVYGGCFKGDGAKGLDKTVLLSSSEDSQQVEKFMAQMPAKQILRDFKPSGKRQQLAVRLTGKFKTAFPDGKPADDAGKDKKSAESKDGTLAESVKDGAVVLIGDSDMAYDHFCVRKQNFFGQEVSSPMNDNFSFFQNLVEQLSGDNNLIGIRSRGVSSRPFDVVRKMQDEAENRYKHQIQALEDDVADAQRKINEMQREKSKDQRYILSAEQKETIDRLRQQEAKRKKELKEVRKSFRRDIDSLENRLKWTNIALMPLLVSLGGIMLAMIKRRRMVRK